MTNVWLVPTGCWFRAFDPARIIISMSVATKLFNERCRWENVCIPSWRNDTAWVKHRSNHCMLFFSKTRATTHMKFIKQHESAHLHNFISSALVGTLNPRPTSFEAIRPPLFFRQALEEGAWHSLVWALSVVDVSLCPFFFKMVCGWAQSLDEDTMQHDMS